MKDNKIWSEDGLDIVEKDIGADARLLFRYQGQISPKMNMMPFEVLLDV
jgi:hypothetical protein